MSLKSHNDARPIASEATSIVADADYYFAKARQHFRWAREAPGERTRQALITLGIAFETKARLMTKAAA